jgi:cytidylate kinase
MNIEVTNASSIIAQFEGVRNVLLDFQREFAKDGAVVDGRDIGTIVLPNADQKFYITASLEVRAKRRFEQYKENNEKIDLKTIKYDIEARDKRDKERSIAPLKIADDAIIIDTSNLCIKSVFDFAAGHINNNLNTNKYKV